MSESHTPPDLEERFRQPEGWRWHNFRRGNRELRFGSAFPKDSIPNAVVVCLPGLGEFGEKYFELARNCLDKNMAFWVLDWMGQGRSGRYLKNLHKRHARSFQDDVEDLHYFIMEYIKHSSVHPDRGRIPLAMLAHSMGANIGLHYLSQHPEMFECAAFSTPMIGIRVLESMPFSCHLPITSVLSLYADTHYVPGGADWSEKTRTYTEKNRFTSDPARAAVHNAWCLADPALQVGDPTYGWLHSAAMSCDALQKKEVLEKIKTPLLMARAGRDVLVDGRAMARMAKRLENATLLDYPDARHEIFMERDEIRGDFLEHFYKLVKETIIDRPETLKPF